MSDREIMNAKNYQVVPPTPKDFARWLQYTLDLEAEEMYGEFGFAVLTEEQQREVIAEIYSRGLIE